MVRIRLQFHQVHPTVLQYKKKQTQRNLCTVKWAHCDKTQSSHGTRNFAIRLIYPWLSDCSREPDGTFSSRTKSSCRHAAAAPWTHVHKRTTNIPNTLCSMSYLINHNHKCQLSLAIPLWVRDKNEYWRPRPLLGMKRRVLRNIMALNQNYIPTTDIVKGAGRLAVNWAGHSAEWDVCLLNWI